MEILLAAHRNDAPGIATVMDGLCQALPPTLASGDRLIVVGASETMSARWTATNGVDVRWRAKPAALGGRYGRFLYEQAAIPFLARGADLVHLGDCRPLRLRRAPYAVTVHDLFFLDAPAWQPPAIRGFKTAMLRLAIADRPAALICVSEYTRSRLLSHVPEARDLAVHVIHPGIAPPGEADPWTPDAPYFLTLSEVNPRKNLLTLLRAFGLARRRGLRLRWKIAGPPGFRADGLVAALASVEGVDVLGRVSDGMREALLRHAAFMAFPSHAEGFGLPPLEAMARGVPTACSAGTAMDETVRDAALRIAPEDVRGWTEALLRLAHEDALRAELAEAGARRASHFTLERMARSHVEVYRSVIEGASSGPRSTEP
jgi:glycosyltransferase involved in cell wall biosynthesis